MHVKNLSNEYARVFDFDAPKTVWMAIVYAFADRICEGGARPEDIRAFVLNEWQILHDNGIVPQKPIKRTAE